MVESQQASLLRSAILDIVIDTINKRMGGGTKYINQRVGNHRFFLFDEFFEHQLLWKMERVLL